MTSATMELLKSKSVAQVAEDKAQAKVQDQAAVAPPSPEPETQVPEAGPAGLVETAEAAVSPQTGVVSLAEAQAKKGKGKTKSLAEAPEILAPDLISNTAHELETIKSADIAAKMVRDILDGNDFNEFKLGGVLAVIQTNGWFGEHSSFKELVELDFGMSYRKAVYLTSTYTKILNSGVSWEDVKTVGWTKLKEIAGVISKDNVKDWVGKAETMTTNQLIEYVKSAEAAQETAAEPASTTVKTVSTLTFKLYEEQRDIVKSAVEAAKTQSGATVDSVALEQICLSFLNNAKQPTLREYMQKVGFEKTLTEFAEVFPNVNLQVEVVED